MTSIRASLVIAVATIAVALLSACVRDTRPVGGRGGVPTYGPISEPGGPVVEASTVVPIPGLDSARPTGGRQFLGILSAVERGPDFASREGFTGDELVRAVGPAELTLRDGRRLRVPAVTPLQGPCPVAGLDRGDIAVSSSESASGPTCAVTGAENGGVVLWLYLQHLEGDGLVNVGTPERIEQGRAVMPGGLEFPVESDAPTDCAPTDPSTLEEIIAEGWETFNLLVDPSSGRAIAVACLYLD